MIEAARQLRWTQATICSNCRSRRADIVSRIMEKFMLMMVALAAVSCMSEIDTYHGESGIYFAMREDVTTVNVDTLYRETSTLPFIVTEKTDSVFNLKVKILGAVADYDREISLRVVDDLSTALQGDYDILQPTYTLPAGEVYGIIPIKFNRTASLQGNERSLVLELMENEDFTLPIRMWRNSTTEYVSVVRHTIVISDKYVQLPGYRTGHFGTFSEKKMKLIIELSGLKLNDFNEILPVTMTKTIGQKLDRYLAEMKAKGTPVYEEDGVTLMKAGDYLY